MQLLDTHKLIDKQRIFKILLKILVFHTKALKREILEGNEFRIQKSFKYHLNIFSYRLYLT